MATKKEATPKEPKEKEIMALDVPRITLATVPFFIVGNTPLILNRMSVKAQHEIFLGGVKKNAAEKAANLKHNPYDEFRASPYILSSDEAPTLLALMASAFKGAMCTAALDLPGMKKAQVGRLVRVTGDYAAVYGMPKLFCAVVRSADINHTPDIRTRAILPRWAVRLEVKFVRELIKPLAVFNLLYAAGQTVGVGDWRIEKGKGDFGSFSVVDEDDPEYQELVATGGREIQIDAMDTAEPYDEETGELLNFWNSETKRRGFEKSPGGFVKVAA